MSTSELLAIYAVFVCLSALFAPEQIVALLEYDGADKHEPWAYLLMWAVFAFSLTGLVIYAIKKASKA